MKTAQDATSIFTVKPRRRIPPSTRQPSVASPTDQRQALEFAPQARLAEPRPPARTGCSQRPDLARAGAALRRRSPAQARQRASRRPQHWRFELQHDHVATLHHIDFVDFYFSREKICSRTINPEAYTSATGAGSALPTKA
ncbi:MAG: hypothetical protein H7A19_18515 [Rhodanobacteraceae bacterium]|nr:hypothetical protein [Rhodanobacteraceae bacterium]